MRYATRQASRVGQNPGTNRHSGGSIFVDLIFMYYLLRCGPFAGLVRAGTSADGLEKRLWIQYFDWSEGVRQAEGLRSEHRQGRIGPHDGRGADT